MCILCARKCIGGGSASCRTIRQLGCLKVEKQLENITMWLLTIADEAELLNKGELIKSSLSLEQTLEDSALQIPIDISYSKLAGSILAPTLSFTPNHFIVTCTPSIES